VRVQKRSATISENRPLFPETGIMFRHSSSRYQEAEILLMHITNDALEGVEVGDFVITGQLVPINQHCASPNTGYCGDRAFQYQLERKEGVGIIGSFDG